MCSQYWIATMSVIFIVLVVNNVISSDGRGKRCCYRNSNVPRDVKGIQLLTDRP